MEPGKHLARPVLKRAVSAFACTFARPRAGHQTDHCGKNIDFAACCHQFGDDLFIRSRMDKLGLAFLANADTGLCAFNATTTDALPGFEAFSIHTGPLRPVLSRSAGGYPGGQRA